MFNAAAGTQHNLQLALQCHQAGDLRQAEALYRQILAVDPRHVDALHFLGVVARQTGHHDAAVELISQALRIQPNFPEALSNLGIILAEMGRHPEAIACCRKAAALSPNFPMAHYNLGNSLREMGELDEAIASFRTAILLQPDFAEGYNNLANALRDKGQWNEAAAAYRQALALAPTSPYGWYNLATVLRDLGQMAEAISCCRKAIELKSDFAEAYFNLAGAFDDREQSEEIIACYRRAIELKPQYAQAYSHLGNVLREKGQLQEAIVCLRKAIDIKPAYPEGHNNLGNGLREKGMLDDAITCYRAAISLKPDFPLAHSNLANALGDRGLFDEAIVHYYKAVALKPDFAQAWNNLGATLRDRGRLDEALVCSRKAVELEPDLAEAHSNLGSVLKDMGRLDEAIACGRRAVELKPNLANADSNVILSLNYHADSTHESILRESLRWARQHAEPLKHLIQPHANSRDPDRRLRIGYVSADFRDHAIAIFMLPLLASHDRKQFEIFCYAQVPFPDAMTARIRAQADAWRSLVGLTYQQAADLIRQDQIDILVDLSLHTAGNRLLTFARKPAPVQATYLAYCSTSGMGTMDYRITDPWLDPPGVNDAYYTEKSVHLPQSYWCYQPTFQTPEPGSLPALRTGHITFGSLNNFCKMSPRALKTWRQLLRAVPGSQLILHAREGSHRQRTLDEFAHAGIEPRRVHFVGHLGASEYFQQYQRIDIGLDPFPFAGGTTTCDALWMGVPVISLAGELAIARGGLSILSNVGLSELVAHTPEDYVRIAMNLANDLPRLAEVRSTLRKRMQASPLMDAPEFARNMEIAYRTMWKNWCDMK